MYPRRPGVPPGVVIAYTGVHSMALALVAVTLMILGVLAVRTAGRWRRRTVLRGGR